MNNQPAARTSQNRESKHNVWIEERDKALVSGVVEVYSFHENEIVLKVSGASLIISGENLHVGKLVLDEGKLEITGRIDGFSYEGPKLVTSVWDRWRKRKPNAVF